jgi:adenylate kinase
MRERVQQPDTAEGVILDGFPRTTTQAVALDAMFSDLNRPLDAALLIDVDAEVIVERLTSRRMCKECGAIGSVADGVNCPKCGGEMYQRDDDNETTVRNRLDVYAKSTSPLIDYYKGCDLLVSIDGDRDPEVVYADVKAALGL